MRIQITPGNDFTDIAGQRLDSDNMIKGTVNLVLADARAEIQGCQGIFSKRDIIVDPRNLKDRLDSANKRADFFKIHNFVQLIHANEDGEFSFRLMSYCTLF